MRKRTYLKLVEYQTEQARRHLEEMRGIHREMRGYKHDFHHHLQTLKGQLENGETDRALAYIDQLDQQLIHMDTLLKTGNMSLDVILSAKMVQAREEHIDVVLKANVPDELEITDLELSIVVGNLLDNAIASSIQTDEQYLKLRMRMGNGVLFLYMVNSCLGIPEGVCELRKLSGKSAFGHGIGLGNIQRIVEKYHGDIEMRCEDSHMETDIMLYMKDL